MAEELEKTCENCKYDYENMEGEHCRHCIHNAEERFEPKEKETSETEIRNKAIDEFLHNAEVKICDRILQNQSRLEFASGLAVANRMLDEIAEQMKCGAE